jgi:urea carboxylase
MGLKHEARKAAIAAGVPVLAGTGLLTAVGEAIEQAGRIGYPVMLKASAGGGGMGMELCEDAEALRLNFEKTVGKALVSSIVRPPSFSRWNRPV